MNIVGRDEWVATGTQSRYGKMRLPADAVWLHHTVTPVTTNPRKDMRKVEQVGQQRFGQFSYSYCVHPDGTVLEGAGRLIGAHTAGRNSRSFGVALIGNYEERSVTVWQVDAVRWLISRLVDDGDLLPGVYPTGGHRDVKATACPGDNAYRVLDMMRVPWCENETLTPKESTVTDDPNLPNITGPLTFHPVVDANGICQGYYVFAPSTGEVHGHGPGAPYHGRSEDPTPG